MVYSIYILLMQVLSHPTNPNLIIRAAGKNCPNSCNALYLFNSCSEVRILKTTGKTLTDCTHSNNPNRQRERERVAYIFFGDALDATHYNLFHLWCTLKRKMGKQNWQTIPFLTLRAYINTTILLLLLLLLFINIIYFCN